MAYCWTDPRRVHDRQQEPLKLLLNQRDPGADRARAGLLPVFRPRARQPDRRHQRAPRRARHARRGAAPRKSSGWRRSRSSSRANCRGCSRRASAAAARWCRSKPNRRTARKELERLKDQQGGLEKLVRELRRALERIDKFPTDSKDAFAKLRGKLAWPVAGKLVASFGQTRAGGVKWDGVLLAGAQGTPVRAVYHGRVVYADWLSGLGLLTIIDHGDGYLSLYGHNERLYKEVGERVTAGDTIATVGRLGRPAAPRAVFRDPQGGAARSTPGRGSRAPRPKGRKGQKRQLHQRLTTPIGRWSAVDVLRNLHGAVRAAGALAAAARGGAVPVRQHRQAAVVERGEHQPGPVRAGAAGDRAARRPPTNERRRRPALRAARRRRRPIYSGCATSAARSPPSSPWSATACKIDANVLPFSYVHDHLKPALELLRRDLLARADIDKLNESLNARDKDLELLLSVTGSHPQASRLRRPAESCSPTPPAISSACSPASWCPTRA